MERRVAADLESQRRYYDQRYSGRRMHMSADERERAEIVHAAIAKYLPRPGLRILEVGSGLGALSAELTRYGSVMGIELSPMAVQRAAKSYGDLDVDFVAGNLFEIDLPEAHFDFVCSLEVIEHVTDQVRFLDRIYGSLRPAGYLALTTPNRWVARYWARQVGAETLQPIENWLSRRELVALVSRRFTVLEAGTLCFNAVHAGPFRVLNSVKLNAVLPFLKRAERRLGWGLHLSLVARKDV